MKKLSVLCSLLFLVVFAGTIAAQGPEPIVQPVLIDSAVYNGIYTGVQRQVFFEPTTRYLITAWYRYYGSSDPDPRRITAAYSMDNGQSWTVVENINQGVGDHMNGRFASVSGNSQTFFIGYGDRNPGGSNRSTRPTLAYDLLGWGGGVITNSFVDDGGTADTVLYGRYLSVDVAPDNENLIAVGCYHNDAPGRAMYYYYSEDGGETWNGPFIPASAAKADSAVSPNYVYNLSFVGMGVCWASHQKVMISCRGQWDENPDALWRIFYSFSNDKGRTWTPINYVPGLETVYHGTADSYMTMSAPIWDLAGNWHIFVVGVDTTQTDWDVTPQPYHVYDCRFDGTTWTVNQFAVPTLLPNGIVAWGDYPADDENAPMNDPAVGLDGTLYYAYTDVIDTTGSGGDESLFNYALMVMYSDDFGNTWKGPVPVLKNWYGRDPHGMAKIASDKIHIVYRRHFFTTRDDQFFYLGVPTDTLKKLATAVENKITKIIPDKFELLQNYPNPFNPSTTIPFTLKKNAHVILTVYNALGQQIATLADKEMTAGFKGVIFDASTLPSGTYYYRLKAGDFVATKEMVLLK